MKKRNLSDEEMQAIRDAIKGIVGNEDFDVEGQVFTDRPNDDDEMRHEKICTELDALADELEQIEHKAEMLVRKVLFNELDTDGAARVCYASAFMTKMNASAQSSQLRFTVDFIRKQSQRDER